MTSKPYTLSPVAIINVFLTMALIFAFGRDWLLRLEVKRLRHIEQTAQETQRELEWNRQARWSSIRLRDEIRRLKVENADLLEELVAARKADKSREQIVPEGPIVRPGQYERVVPGERQR